MGMILTHADAGRVELRDILTPEKYDAQVSIAQNASLADNDWSLELPDAVWSSEPIRIGHWIYLDGTEWGGPVETIRHDTASETVTLTGPLWRGMLKRKVITPPAGAAYYTVNGEANSVLAAVIGGLFGDLFTVSQADTGILLSGAWRYTELHDALERALEDAGLTLQITYDATQRKAVLAARRVIDSSDSIDLSQDYGIPMVSSAGKIGSYNHVIALGAGELLERDVLDVYRLDDGTMTTTAPAWAGTLLDRQVIYDYNNPESLEGLRQGAEKRLLEYAPQNGVQLDPGDVDLELPLGDIVGARDRLTGLAMKARILQKILTIDSNGYQIETKVG